MILFLEDWAKYPGAIVDTKTANTSFLDIANVYKKMGIKNYYFMLALLDRGLQGVDPFDPDLSPEMISRIKTEATLNPWYHYREIACSRDGDIKSYFLANRGNMAMYFCYYNNAMFYIIQCRQTGKTFGMMHLEAYNLCYTRKEKGGLMTKDPSLRNNSIRQLRSIISEYPWYLNPIDPKKDTNNSENISVYAYDNFLYTAITQPTLEGSEKVFRGMQLSTLMFDEIAWIRHIPQVWGSATPAMSAAGPRAISRGNPSGTIVATTPGKKDTEHGMWAYELYNQWAPFDESFFDCKNRAEFEAKVRGLSRPNDVMSRKVGIYGIAATFTHRQLGKDDDWLANNISKSGGTPEDILRDWYLVWTSGSESSPFTVKQTQMIRMSEQEPEAQDLGGYIPIKWYKSMTEIEDIMLNKPVVLGIDSSNMVSNDNTGLVFVDATNLDILGVGTINRVNLFKFSKWLCELMMKYNRLLVIPENRSSAQGIIDYLLETLPAHGIDPFRRIFNTVVHEKQSNPKRFQQINTSSSRLGMANQFRNAFGYTTSGSGAYSRDNLYNETFYRAIDLSADKLKDKGLIDELLKLVIHKGRIDHPVNGHDDTVVAWLLACWFIFNGRETSYYQINPGRFLSETTEAGKEINPEELARIHEQELLKDKIKNKYDELRNTSDFFLFAKLEREIKALEGQLDNRARDQLSISSMIDNLKEEKQLRIMRGQPNAVNDIIAGLDVARNINYGTIDSYGDMNSFVSRRF